MYMKNELLQAKVKAAAALPNCKAV